MNAKYTLSDKLVHIHSDVRKKGDGLPWIDIVHDELNVYTVVIENNIVINHYDCSGFLGEEELRKISYKDGFIYASKDPIMNGDQVAVFEDPSYPLAYDGSLEIFSRVVRTDHLTQEQVDNYRREKKPIILASVNTKDIMKEVMLERS